MRNTIFICLAILLPWQPAFMQEAETHYHFKDQNITSPLFNGDPSSMEDYSVVYVCRDWRIGSTILASIFWQFKFG
ncbi:MAG: hypothetical protein HOM94_04655 [Candidatus Marinimicrobia bacterium]|nr:hypothetical protein [Candidatus Neomarinimicrobiota bacterium]MBT6915117.1 hypothetical protein [Candidatus Neomarinimicrobiota bacterium]